MSKTPTSEFPSNTSEYLNLMHSARLESQRNKFELSQKNYSKAAEFARQVNMSDEADIAEAAWLKLKGEIERASRILSKVIDSEETGPTARGLACFYLASLRCEQRELDSAIRYYLLTLTSLQLPWLAWAHNNLADAYEMRSAISSRSEEERRDDEASARQNYLEGHRLSEGTPTQYIVKYNLGFCYLRVKSFDEAIIWFENALLDNPNLHEDQHFEGIVNRELGTACFLKGWDLIENVGGLAIDSLPSEMLERAIKCWDSARENLTSGAPESKSNIDRRSREKAAIVRAKCAICKRVIKELNISLEWKSIKPGTDDFALLEWIPPIEVHLYGYSSPEERITTKIVSTEQDAYDRYMYLPPSPYESLDSFLSILRGWGSTVPLIEGAQTDCRGGGYFLKWNGVGVVIDPGVDFLKNFLEAGHHLREVQAVIVSHNHPDHNLDLSSFDDLRYELYRRCSEDDRRDAWRYSLLCDENTYTNFKAKYPSGMFPSHIGPTIRYMSVQQYYENERERKNGRGSLISVTVDLSIELKSLPFRIRYFKTQHGSDVPYSVGFCIECLSSESKDVEVRIGFTSDTRFFEALCDDYHLNDCHILVAHMSQPDVAELQKPDVSKRGPHLGYRGVQKLIDGCKSPPELTLIGEYWAGLADIRLETVQGLRLATGKEKIYPTSVGMMIDPGTRKIRCSSCQEWVLPNQIFIAPPTVKLGRLLYLCQLCRVDGEHVG